jgi:hypothetical protein
MPGSRALHAMCAALCSNHSAGPLPVPFFGHDDHDPAVDPDAGDLLLARCAVVGDRQEPGRVDDEFAGAHWVWSSSAEATPAPTCPGCHM